MVLLPSRRSVSLYLSLSELPPPRPRCLKPKSMARAGLGDWKLHLALSPGPSSPVTSGQQFGHLRGGTGSSTELRGTANVTCKPPATASAGGVGLVCSSRMRALLNSLQRL